MPEQLIGLMFGTLASICWGVGDYIAGGASRKVGEHLTLLAVLSVSVVGVALYTVPRGVAVPSPQGATLLVATSLVTLFGYLALYRAFRVGLLSLASGIASCNAIIPVILALVLLGERPLPWQYAGIVMVLAGAVMLSVLKGTPQPHQHRELGVAPALTAMVLFGLGLFGMKLSVDAAGADTLALTMRVIGVLVLGGWLGVTGKLVMPPPEARAKLLFAGLLDAAALILFCEALSHTLLSLVAPISSTIPVVTVGLAYFLLHERLRFGQWLGLGLAILGITLVAIS